MEMCHSLIKKKNPKIHRSLPKRRCLCRRLLSLGRSVWMFPRTNCLRFPSPSAQFVSCLFRRRSRVAVIPPHLLKLPAASEKLLPSLRFLSCHFRAVNHLRPLHLHLHPTAPLNSSRSLPRFSLGNRKNKLFAPFLHWLMDAFSRPSSASQSLRI